MKSTSTTKTVLFLSAALLLIVTGCASKQDVETLQTETMKSRRESRELYAQLEQQIQQTKQAAAPMREKQASIWAEVESLRTQVAILQGQIDALTVRLNSRTTAKGGSVTLEEVANEVQAISFALEHQLAVDLNAARKSMPKTDTAAQGAETAGQNGTNDPKGAQQEAKNIDPAEALYSRALDAFKDKKYEEARRYWAEFVNTFKKNPKVPNAIFWQGECYYQLKNYGKAVLAYQDVIAKYSKSPKFRSALLKQGISFYKIGKSKAGKLVLQDLLNRFPKSVEANRARIFLEEQ